MERESKEGLDNIDGSQPSSGSGVIIMQRLVSDQTSAPANDIPPPVADHRSRRSLVTERGGQGAGPASRGARQSETESRSHQLLSSDWDWDLGLGIENRESKQSQC